MPQKRTEVDIPCDAQQMGEFNMPFALLTEARHPETISVGTIVTTGDEDEPLFARVHAVTTRGEGATVVHLDLIRGDRVR
jgi:hypothetical protein